MATDDEDDDELQLLEDIIAGFVGRAARDPDLCVFCERRHKGGDINGLPACPRCLRRTAGHAPAAGAARVRKLVARAIARNAADVEGRLVEFRKGYTEMGPEARDRLRAVVKKGIARLKRTKRNRDLLVVMLPAGRVREDEPEGAAVEYTEAIPSVISVRTLVKAIEAWDRGEEFLAGLLDS